MLESNKKKVYGISAGTAGAVGMVVFWIARDGSYSVNIIMLGIFLGFTTLLMLLGIFVIVVNFIKKKKIKQKFLLLGIFSMWLLSLSEFIDEYLKMHNINDNITMCIMPLAFIGFLYIGVKIQLPKLNSEKERIGMKRKIGFVIVVMSVFEVFMLYQTIILHK